KLPELELLRDVETRWDSIYFMINRLRALRQAVEYFLSLPNQEGLSRYKLSPVEWKVLEDFERILQIPHMVQQRMSNESLPRLGSSIPCFELFMSAWENLAATQGHL
ncbi:hypothetical protein BJ138DRAFT_984604, partial [Hygrophoropsis aurantiaca]